jgi:hypothetical protein
VANRVLSFAYKRFDGRVPEPGELDDADRDLLAKVEAGFQTAFAIPVILLAPFSTRWYNLSQSREMTPSQLSH